MPCVRDSRDHLSAHAVREPKRLKTLIFGTIKTKNVFYAAIVPNTKQSKPKGTEKTIFQ